MVPSVQLSETKLLSILVVIYVIAIIKVQYLLLHKISRNHYCMSLIEQDIHLALQSLYMVGLIGSHAHLDTTHQHHKNENSRML